MRAGVPPSLHRMSSGRVQVSELQNHLQCDNQRGVKGSVLIVCRRLWPRLSSRPTSMLGFPDFQVALIAKLASKSDLKSAAQVGLNLNGGRDRGMHRQSWRHR